MAKEKICMMIVDGEEIYSSCASTGKIDCGKIKDLVLEIEKGNS